MPSNKSNAELAGGQAIDVLEPLLPRRFSHGEGSSPPPVVETSRLLTKDDVTPPPDRSSLMGRRRVRRVANARSVVMGLAITFVGLAFVGAIVMRIVDPDNFPSLGLAVWWALQTVTTVGYGDVVPTTAVGRVIGGIEMVLGVSFIAFLTAGVTSVVIQRATAEAQVIRACAR